MPWSRGLNRHGSSGTDARRLVYKDSENIRKVVKDIFSGAVKKNPYYPLSGPRLGTLGPPQLVIQALGVQLELNKPLT